jgi:hypothetical protein
MLMSAAPVAEMVGPSSFPPAVVAVSVGSSAWTEAFRQEIRENGAGTVEYGYWASPYDRQKPALSWVNLDQISIWFNLDMVLRPEHLQVRGITVADYPVVDVRFDRSTYVGTWTLGRPLTNDRLILELNGDAPDGVRTGTDAYLDGDKDGIQGGDYHLRIDVLPGGSGGGAVGKGRVFDLRTRLGTSSDQPGGPGSGRYWYRADIDGDGRIGALDFAEVRRRLFTQLPPGLPSAAARAPLDSTGVFSVQRIRPTPRGLLA